MYIYFFQLKNVNKTREKQEEKSFRIKILFFLFKIDQTKTKENVFFFPLLPSLPINFLVMSAFGRKIRNNQNGCGPNVAKLNAVWIGSGDVTTSNKSAFNCVSE